MATDLTKMVEEGWHEQFNLSQNYPRQDLRLPLMLLAMAKQIEANREEIEKLKIRHGERIEMMARELLHIPEPFEIEERYLEKARAIAYLLQERDALQEKINKAETAAECQKLMYEADSYHFKAMTLVLTPTNWR